MSLRTNLESLITRLGTEFKTAYTRMTGNNTGDLTALTTTDKSSLLAAINEINGGGAANTDGLAEGSVNLYFTDARADARITNAIDDAGAPAANTLWSSSKVNTEVAAAVSGLVDAAPGTMDTLNELAAALGDDANFATTINTQLGNRVRFDQAQPLTVPQQVQAQANMNVYNKDELGAGIDTVDWVALFDAALV